ncbi:MAG: diadenylate cyclase [Planctomycetota bacterium]
MSNPVVRYFMWSYQGLFQGSAKFSAKALFEELLPGTNPRVFLVGLLQEDRTDRHPVCVEPDHDPIQPDAFEGLAQKAAEELNNDPRKGSLYSHPIAAERVHTAMRYQATRRAIEKCCEDSNCEGDSVYFASMPTLKDGYLIFCVLRIERSIYEGQFRLPSKEIGGISVCQSFVDAVIQELLCCLQTSLYEPDAGVNLSVVKASTEELLRRGGSRFLQSIGWSVFQCDSLDNAYGLCSAMTTIAGSTYETEHAHGKLVLCQTEEIDFPAFLKFETPVRLTEHRRIRKLLELTRSDFSLILADVGVVGLAQSSDDQRPDIQKFEIEILGHHYWRVVRHGVTLCEFWYGTPRLPRPKVDFAQFADLCERLLPDNSEIAELWNVINAAVKQRHGTTLVISNKAAQEVWRLTAQSTNIIPMRITSAVTNALSSIDGALVLDQHAVCHGFGTILDGIAGPYGDAGRGARFNSAIRYLAAHGEGCIVVIVSEDSDVTLLPKLPSRVHRGKVEEALRRLIDSSQESPLRPRVYAEALSAVEEYGFYLSQEQCDVVNELITRVEKALDDEGREVRILRWPLKPHRAMNESYFFTDHGV